MKGKHLFILPRGSYRGANEAEVVATINGLIEMGLCKLPYDRDVYIQMAGSDCLNHKDVQISGSFADRNVSVLIGPLGNVKEGLDELRVVAMNTANRYELNLFETQVDHASLVMLAESAANLLVVLLATRNVVKTTKENKLAKLGIGKKNPMRRFAYTTTISFPAEMDDHESVVPGGAKCPHLRRGHIRRQHYGPGNQFEKKIWIDPVFVNADPDFVDQRAAYNVSPKLKGENA